MMCLIDHSPRFVKEGIRLSQNGLYWVDTKKSIKWGELPKSEDFLQRGKIPKILIDKKCKSVNIF